MIFAWSFGRNCAQSRGPKPALSREDVVQAAISVADEGDLSALTMQAVAKRLGFTTMALYRYFPNKGALIDASVDAAMGTPPPRNGPREGWRQELNPEDMMDVLSVVHGYVSGSSDTAISYARAKSRGISLEEWSQAVSADLCRAINHPRYPILSSILTSVSGGISEASPLPARGGRPRTLDESFDFGLERVLDGIECYMDSLKGT